MRNNVIWAIRDARGLTTSEKAFLFVIESRGVTKCYRQTLMNDTSVSDGQVTNLVRSLKAKGCLTLGKSGGRTTYRVNEMGVRRLVPNRSPSEDESSAIEDQHSLSEAECSLSEDNKKKDKKNKKIELEEEQDTPSAKAPVVSTTSNLSVRENGQPPVPLNVEPPVPPGTGTNVEKDNHLNVHYLTLSREERRLFDQAEATPEQRRQAVETYCNGRLPGHGWRDRAELALASTGVEVEEW